MVLAQSLPSKPGGFSEVAERFAGAAAFCRVAGAQCFSAGGERRRWCRRFRGEKQIAGRTEAEVYGAVGLDWIAPELREGAVRYQFHLLRAKQTQRILRAMDNRYFTILAHPTGRLINQREPYDVDLERILQRAKERGCFMELNAQPDRLDLDDNACRMAKELGVKVAISTDAHSTGTLAYMRHGVDPARRGWLTAADVLNTRRLPELQRLLKRA